MVAEHAPWESSVLTRVDLVGAIEALYPETRNLDWEYLTDQQVRRLSQYPRALWVIIIRGPGDNREDRNHVTSSRFGRVSWPAAARICRRSRQHLWSDIDEVVGKLSRYLSGPAVDRQPVDVSRVLRCAPPVIHAFCWGGTPHEDAMCVCGAARYGGRKLRGLT